MMHEKMGRMEAFRDAPALMLDPTFRRRRGHPDGKGGIRAVS